MKTTTLSIATTAAVFSCALALSGSARADDATTLVHVEANHTYVTLERQVGAAWTTACTTPCDRRVPEGEYRLAGDGLRATRTFRVTGERFDVRGDLAAHSTLTTGAVMSIVGGALAIGGVSVFSAALTMRPSNADASNVSVALFVAGPALAAAGIGLLVPGLIMLATGSSALELSRAPRVAGLRWTWGGPVLAF